jgi:hypothetical protein
MKKDHPTSESAFVNPRIFAAFVLCSFGAWIAMLSFASTPSSGTLTTASGAVTYAAGPFLQANPSPLGLGQVDQGPRCNGTTFPCDSFDLTVSLPAGYTGTHCNAAVKVTLSWVDAGTGQSDTICISMKASSVIWEVIHPLTSSLQRADTVPKLQPSLPSRTAQRITR